jgi:signal transduction histidine kinase
VCKEEGWVNIVVTDNGKGFPADTETALLNGSGLRGIKNRIFLLNGEMNLNSKPGRTVIAIRFKNEIELSKVSNL